VTELIDEEDAGRTTVTLLASLAARMAALYVMSGADAIGSLTAGFAAYGRELSQTEHGARMRRALAASRIGSNGEAIWKALRIDQWASTIPPSPVMQQMRNDVALVAAGDIADAIAQLPVPAHPSGIRGLPTPIDVNFLDFTLGLWGYAKEVVAALDSLAEPTMNREPTIIRNNSEEHSNGGSMLR
jgi:hypothetical protein